MSGVWEIQLQGEWQKLSFALFKGISEAQEKGLFGYQFETRGQGYFIDFEKLEQRNLVTGRVRKLRVRSPRTSPRRGTAPRKARSPRKEEAPKKRKEAPVVEPVVEPIVEPVAEEPIIEEPTAPLMPAETPLPVPAPVLVDAPLPVPPVLVDAPLPVPPVLVDAPLPVVIDDAPVGGSSVVVPAWEPSCPPAYTPLYGVAYPELEAPPSAPVLPPSMVSAASAGAPLSALAPGADPEPKKKKGRFGAGFGCGVAAAGAAGLGAAIGLGVIDAADIVEPFEAAGVAVGEVATDVAAEVEALMAEAF